MNSEGDIDMGGRGTNNFESLKRNMHKNILKKITDKILDTLRQIWTSPKWKSYVPTINEGSYVFKWWYYRKWISSTDKQWKDHKKLIRLSKDSIDFVKSDKEQKNIDKKYDNDFYNQCCWNYVRNSMHEEGIKFWHI
ncbi:14240_t:CDS:2 [Gigaspora rosea]|nr:14240_t:CDS:2 [Gigaspora rosea]